jgi:hypothetical protein
LSRWLEVTVATQEADQAMITTTGKEIKTEKETVVHTDKMDSQSRYNTLYQE